MNNPVPQVRIGMIQSAETIRFQCESAFDVLDLQGNRMAHGKANTPCEAVIQFSEAAGVRYRVRLAIALTEEEAEKRRRKFKSRGIATTLWRPGVVLTLHGFTMDNREYWIVTEAFADEAAAKQFALEYEPVGEAVVVKEIVRKPSGTLQLMNQPFVDGCRIVPADPKARIQLFDVTVGIEFHWQHQRTQVLPGILEIGFNNAGRLLAVNELDIETYLISVNSSEMTRDNPVELLKAQTIAARSTILATMGKHHYDEKFHLCSDDHCQCYHGVANISEFSRAAAVETEGVTLLHEGRVCDARYAKICGGIMEDYAHIWDERDVPYLVPGVDGREKLSFPLADEEQTRAYIDSSPDVWCNTQKYAILSSLPYNTRDLFRWKVSYPRRELSELISRRLRIQFGELVDLVPGDRAPGGRLIFLDIVGSERTVRIGKELVIRRALSESHLYSACFYIERDRNASGQVERFHLIGAGWGHGVGLCQVGATVMAQQGYDHAAILAHYYKHSQLVKLY
ncbi:MAG TPA: SpoIID/LytB domain-containing protein [bacterium]|nr:SpoIID/LytB domain-containing protein [bacterium]HQG44633.1 SpoIID/LytB domain-containing protein [bacterium]HQI49592.1 SpoIID/LytB domain-containing protein [bacterium]HQJ63274.1 SpoIID/LytB domain-containing protein [bacterium]